MTHRTGPRDRAGRKRPRGSEYRTAIVRRAIGSETLPVGDVRADDRATIDEISSLCVPFRLGPAERLAVFRLRRRCGRFASAASGRYVQPKRIASQFDHQTRCRVQRDVRRNDVAYGFGPALSQQGRAPKTERGPFQSRKMRSDRWISPACCRSCKHTVPIERAIQLKEMLDRIEIPAFDDIPDREAMERNSAKKWRLPDTEIDFVLIEDGPRAGSYAGIRRNGRTGFPSSMNASSTCPTNPVPPKS